VWLNLWRCWMSLWRRWVRLLLRLGLSVHRTNRIRCTLLRGRSLRPCLHSGWRGVVLHTQRPGGNHVLRVTAVRLGKRALIGPGRLYMLCLERCRSHVLVAIGNPLLGPWLVLYAAWPTIIGNVPVVDDRVSHHDRPVDIGGMNDGFIHAHNRGVVGKLAAAPFTAGKTDAFVTKAIVHTAVVAHVASPVPLMEPVVATGPAPIVRRPQSAFIGRLHPGAGDPIVIPFRIGPVTRRPHQIGLGAVGLLIDRQFRWSEPNTDADLCV